MIPDAAQLGEATGAVRRHAEAGAPSDRVGRLEGALDRRALIERARGIRMERRGVAERAARDHLRSHATSNGRTVADTARAVVEGHGLLPPR